MNTGITPIATFEVGYTKGFARFDLGRTYDKRGVSKPEFVAYQFHGLRENINLHLLKELQKLFPQFDLSPERWETLDELIAETVDHLSPTRPHGTRLERWEDALKYYFAKLSDSQRESVMNAAKASLEGSSQSEG